MDAKIAEEISGNSGMELRDDYSGRGMYGSETSGVVGNMNQFIEGLVEATIYAVEDDDQDLLRELRRLNVQTDSMGLETIFY